MADARSFAPLLAAVQQAEAISRDVALRQAALAPTPQLRHALLHQGRQEAMHAGLFGAALRCVPSRAGCPAPVARVLHDYARHLHADIDAGRLAASMVGLQWVFEGLGTAALEPSSHATLIQLCDRLVPLGKLILQQEAAHRRLGRLWVPRLAARLNAGEMSVLVAASVEYAALAGAIVGAAVGAFGELDSEIANIADVARRRARDFGPIPDGTRTDSEGPSAVISIVMPVYNEEKALPRALSALLSSLATMKSAGG